MDRRKIVLGLGNPGQRYRDTRHNIGFGVLDRLADRQRVRFRSERAFAGRAWVAELQPPGGAVLAKPRTYMNRSGRAAAALCRHYAAEPADLIVVYDDADLVLGKVRIRTGGGTGGHNGVRSLIEVLGTPDFPRLRLGVRGAGRDAAELADYVLEPFEPEEQKVARALAELGAEITEAILRDGLEEAMNQYNGRSVEQDADAAPEP